MPENSVNPETIANKAVESGVLTTEANNEADPNSARVQKVKNFLKGTGRFILNAERIGLVNGASIFWNLFKIAKEAVTGKMSFERGYELGKASSEDKKGK